MMVDADLELADQEKILRGSGSHPPADGALLVSTAAADRGLGGARVLVTGGHGFLGRFVLRATWREPAPR